MMILKEFLPCLTPSIRKILLVLLLMASGGAACGQETSGQRLLLNSKLSNISHSEAAFENSVEYPDPKSVLKQSLIVPGWGQVTNKQAWKVPIVYGLLGGLTYYSVYLHKKYHDYRAAYYNAEYGAEGGYRFGPTPSYIPENANKSALKSNRNFYRNRRDFVYISIGLAYALNVVDAYVFAHLRSFDVSDDLSMKPGIKLMPEKRGQLAYTPAISLKFSFN